LDVIDVINVIDVFYIVDIAYVANVTHPLSLQFLSTSYKVKRREKVKEALCFYIFF